MSAGTCRNLLGKQNARGHFAQGGGGRNLPGGVNAKGRKHFACFCSIQAQRGAASG